MRTTNTLAGSLVAVTGASGGLGRAIAEALDRRGARLALTGRRTDALEALAKGLRNSTVITCDLAAREQVDELASQLSEVDVLIANAALPAAGVLDDFTVLEVDRALDVNLRAPILLAKALAPRMRERGRGHLVFVASMGAKLPAPRLSIYAATKYGLRGFAACLRQELHGSGVGVSVVFPGSVTDVGMFAESGAQTSVKGVTSAKVANAVINAIEDNRAEVDVAPWSLRVGTTFAHVAPGTYAKLALRSGSDSQTLQLAEGLRHKR
jgi:short-subunit dehydrogenase